jgi:hypothetical protein
VHREFGVRVCPVDVAEPQRGVGESGERLDLRAQHGQFLGQFAGAPVAVGRLAMPAERGRHQRGLLVECDRDGHLRRLASRGENFRRGGDRAGRTETAVFVDSRQVICA